MLNYAGEAGEAGDGCVARAMRDNYRQSRPTSTGVRCVASRHCFVRLTADVKPCPRIHFSHNMQQSKCLRVDPYPCRVCLQNCTFAHACVCCDGCQAWRVPVKSVTNHIG